MILLTGMIFKKKIEEKMFIILRGKENKGMAGNLEKGCKF